MERTRAIWGARIRAARQAAGYTQQTFAIALGIDQANVSRWERGRAMPHDTRRRQLAQLLGIDPNVLFAYPPDGGEEAA